MSEKNEKKTRPRIESIRRVRGMQDFLPSRAAGLRRIARIAEDIARLYGFERVEIPILERASLYRRSLGLGSDVVMKEMYAFEDKKDKNENSDELCLRPEGTAGVMRMLIENGLTQTLPQRWFYEGAMFRRERPQRGRFRQFHQCGVEMLTTQSWFAIMDVEVIRSAWFFLKSLGLENKVIFKFNWIGKERTRDRAIKAIKKHFQTYADKKSLSEISIERIERNPLRIFDSKDPMDQEAIKNAPPIARNKKTITSVKELCDNLNIPYIYDPHLVRGLDYYNDFVFEFVENDSTRAQSTVLAGGRYDALCAQLGGNYVCAVGWAAGLERLLDLCDFKKEYKIKILVNGSLDNRHYIEKVREILYEKVLPEGNQRIIVTNHYPYEYSKLSLTKEYDAIYQIDVQRTESQPDFTIFEIDMKEKNKLNYSAIFSDMDELGLIETLNNIINFHKVNANSSGDDLRENKIFKKLKNFFIPDDNS